jgi:putative ABC transport system permease protein
LPAIGNLLSDTRLALRTTRRSPVFCTVTIVLMALGIAATSTLFSLMYGVLLKPLPWFEPERVVRLQETRAGKAGRVPWTITNTTYHAWREQPATIESIGGWMRPRLMNVSAAADAPDRLTVASVTPSLFQTVGVPPVIGRYFSDEDVNSGVGVIVLGYYAWQRQFGGVDDIVGRTLRLNDNLVTVVGVMPVHFALPDHETEAWVPLRLPRVDPGAKSISGVIFNAVARLRPGATPAQAAAEATARGRAAPSLRSAGIGLFGSEGDISVSVVSAREALTAEVRPALLMFLAAVVLLFATAIGSIVLMQSARAVERTREMAVRAALGAGKGRLAVAWLVESAVLGTAGGVAGMVLSGVFHRAIPLVVPPGFPRLDDVALDMRVVVFSAGLTLLASLVCGLVPALQSRETNLHAALSSDRVTPGPVQASHRGRLLRASMIVAQVAVACVLLVGTGLLARSFVALLSADRGFDPQNVLTAYGSRPATPLAADAASLERARDRIRALPGVTDVAFANALPFVTAGGFFGTTLPSRENPAATVQVQAMLRVVSPEYFGAMGLRLLDGRFFDGTDTSTSRPVVVVNKTFAAEYLPATAVGSVLPTGIGSRNRWEVIGVVDDMRQGGVRGVAPSQFGGLTDPSQPELFFTYRQSDWNVNEVAYVVRSAGDPGSVAASVRGILGDESPSLTIDTVATMEALLLDSLARPRTYALLIAGFALFATGVALVGLFGVLSLMAARRTREIGIRTALGARRRDIVRLISGEAAILAVSGIGVGLAAAFAVVQWLSSFLFGVTTRDPVTFVAIPVFLLLASAVASAIPACRAARMNPTVALRSS